jgi:hypothetical protein
LWFVILSEAKDLLSYAVRLAHGKQIASSLR